MRVYYNSSIWGKGKGSFGFPQRTNWKFEFMGTKRYIPVIYHFPKGIVFDIITILDEIKLRKFFEKYKAVEEKLTPIQKRCVKQEHPYQAVCVKEIWINGKKAEGGYSSSSSMSIPWVQQNDDLIPIQKAYAAILKDETCFACERFCVPYHKEDSKIQKLLCFLRISRVKKMKLSTYPVKRFLPLDIHFSVNEKQKEFCFTHPITGIKHTLYFQDGEFIEFPFKSANKLYSMQLMYEIEPALPEGDTLEFDSSIQYSELSDDKFSATSASSIGIIGGAYGPTSIFILSDENEGIHKLPLYSCFSVPSFQKEDTSHFILKGINTKDCDSKEYNF